jgi:prepilin-type N-terminal cleavage/methylation domain-containing protein
MKRNRGGTRRATGGFTLIEILVVMGIIGILVSLILPALGQAIRAGRAAATMHTISNISAGLEAFKNDWACYPPSAPPTEGTVSDGGPYTYGYQLLVYYLMGPGSNTTSSTTRKGWGTLYQGKPPFGANSGGTSKVAAGPYYMAENPPDIDTADASSTVQPPWIRDAFRPGQAILYFRFEPGATPQYDVSNNPVDSACKNGFASQTHFELLVKPNGKWVRQDFLLISAGEDRYWGLVKPEMAGSSATGRMIAATATDTNGLCDDLCNFGD